MLIGLKVLSLFGGKHVQLSQNGVVAGTLPNYYSLPTCPLPRRAKPAKSKLNLCEAFGGCACEAHDPGSALPGEVEEVEVVPDVPLVDATEVVDDPSISYRSMSREALLAEMKTKEHQASHVPYNPYCLTCRIACMEQKRYGKKTGRGKMGKTVDCANPADLL